MARVSRQADECELAAGGEVRWGDAVGGESSEANGVQPFHSLTEGIVSEGLKFLSLSATVLPDGRTGWRLSPGAKLSGQPGGVVRIAQGGNLVELIPERNKLFSHKAIGGPRGEVNTFSRQSRRRLRLLFDSLNCDAVSGSLFVTLTYHANMRDAKQAKLHLQSFHKRLVREYTGSYENIAVIWRMEVQKRGSIHFHLLVFGLPFIHYQWIADNWTDIVAPGDVDQLRAGTQGTQVKRVKSYGETRHYLEKYLSKQDISDDDEDDQAGPGSLDAPGRWWGVRGSLDSFKASVHEERVDSYGLKQLARTLDKLNKARVRSIIAAKNAKSQAPGWMYGWARRRKKRVLYQTSRWSLDASCLVARLPDLIGVWDV